MGFMRATFLSWLRFDFKAINAIAIASVVPPLNYTLKTMAETYFHLSPLFVDSSTNTGLKFFTYRPLTSVPIASLMLWRQSKNTVRLVSLSTSARRQLLM